jgi:outer membrane protein assembly factor BamE
MIKLLWRFFIVVLLASSITSCAWVYRYPIQQGNILSQSQISRIHHGQTKKQVVKLLGQPILQNIFTPNRLVYAYSLEDTHNKLHTKQFIVYLKNNKVVRVQHK